jgi:hypothetical protein
MKEDSFNADELLEEVQTVTHTARTRRQEANEEGPCKFCCKCSVCKTAAIEKLEELKDPNAEKDDIANYEGSEQSFTWLLKQLGEASAENLIKLNIPDTITYKRGKAEFILQPVKDFQLKYSNKDEKLRKEDIMKNFNNIVRLRKRDDLSSSIRTGKPDVYGKEVALVRYYVKGKDNETAGSSKDEEGPLRVLMENEFFELMFERMGSPIWRQIAYMQTVIKTRTGVGEVRLVNYYSHDTKDTSAIEELQRAGQAESNEDELMVESEAEYCHLICRRVAYFLATYSKVELLRMRAEFMRDDNGRVWLMYATKIAVKKIDLDAESDENVLFRRVNLESDENKARVESEILVRTVEPSESVRSLRLSRLMKQHYEEVKETIGVNKLFEPEQPDYISNKAFARLRPMSPYSMEELLSHNIEARLAERFLLEQITRRKPPRHTQSSAFTPRVTSYLPSLTSRKQHSWTYNSKMRVSPYQSMNTLSRSQASASRYAM